MVELGHVDQTLRASELGKQFLLSRAPTHVLVLFSTGAVMLRGIMHGMVELVLFGQVYRAPGLGTYFCRAERRRAALVFFFVGAVMPRGMDRSRPDPLGASVTRVGG